MGIKGKQVRSGTQKGDIDPAHPALALREEWTKPLTPTLATRSMGVEAVSALINQ